MNSTEQQRRLVDCLIRRRAKTIGKTESEAVKSLLAQMAGLPDDTAMIVNTTGETIDARTIRIWASFYKTPETKH